MSILVAKAGRSGAGGANSEYITRLSAAEKIAFHNLEHLESEVIAEARTNAIAYAHAREEIELAKARMKLANSKPINERNQKTENRKTAKYSEDSASSTDPAESKNATASATWKSAGSGRLGNEIIEVLTEETDGKTGGNIPQKPKKELQVRTHYRLIASWEGKVTSENAVSEVKIYLGEQFPMSRAIIAVHQDTDDTHAHVWIDARQINGKKIHLKEDRFESLDEKWTQQYDRSYGTNYAPEYKKLKEETKQWKRDMYEWRKSQGQVETATAENTASIKNAENTGDAENAENVEGARLNAPPPKPQRVSDRFKTDYWKEKEIQQISGSQIYEQINPRTDHSNAQRANRYTETSDSFTRTRNDLTETGGKFARKAEFINQGAEYDDRSTEQKGGGDERFADRTKSDFSGAAQNGAELIQPDDRYHQSSENGRTGFAQSETDYSFDTDQSSVDSQRTGRVTDKTTAWRVSQERFYANRTEFDSTDGSGISGSNQEDFFRNSTIGKFNVELSQMPEIQFQTPEFRVDPQTMVENTVALIENNLERQGRVMHELAICLYREHLNGIATTPPSQAMTQKINQLNQVLPEEERIKTENKSWLEANHDYLLSLTSDKLDKEAVRIADEFEDDVVDRQKWDPLYREREGISFGT